MRNFNAIDMFPWGIVRSMLTTSAFYLDSSLKRYYCQCLPFWYRPLSSSFSQNKFINHVYEYLSLLSLELYNMSLLVKWLNWHFFLKGWRLVDIFIAQQEMCYGGGGKKNHYRPRQLNTIWFFEKEAALVNDQTPKYQVRYSRWIDCAHIKYQANTLSCLFIKWNFSFLFSISCEWPNSQVPGPIYWMYLH